MLQQTTFADELSLEILSGELPAHSLQKQACGQFAEVHGVKMFYRRTGFGPTLVLIHGMTGSNANWRMNLGALSSRATVYAIDLPNMGNSERVAGLDTGLQATADRIAAWMDAVGLEQADIAGHSHGGAIAMMLAARHPHRVRSLMLFAPANPYSHVADHLVRFYSSAAGSLFAHQVPSLPRRVHMFALARMYGNPARIAPDSLEGYTRGLRVPGTMPHILQIVRNWFSEMRALEGALPLVARRPCLLIWGDRDRAVSLASGRRLQRELSGSEFVVIQSAGHVAFEELPAECNRIVLGWLDRMELRHQEWQPIAGVGPRREAAAGRSALAG